MEMTIHQIKVEVAKVRANMKEQAKQGHDKPGVVYTSSLVDVDEETLASLQSADICKRTIRNQRAQGFPKVPDNCREIIIQGEWEQNCQVIHSCSLTVDMTVSLRSYVSPHIKC